VLVEGAIGLGGTRHSRNGDMGLRRTSKHRQLVLMI
jgi:hypothetical protein